MNLELHSLKDTITDLSKQLQELRTMVKTSSYAHYFVIQYKLEYLEPIRVETLLDEMKDLFPIEDVYIILSQQSDKTYENPILNIFRYNIDLTLFLRCKKKVHVHQVDSFFETKLGIAFVDHYISSSEFQKAVAASRSKIHAYYQIEDGKIIQTSIQ